VTKFIKCKLCNAKIEDKCEFAIHKRTCNGEEYIFCCEKCAETYKE